MATDRKLVQGQPADVNIADPKTVEALLLGFLDALIKEQRPAKAGAIPPTAAPKRKEA